MPDDAAETPSSGPVGSVIPRASWAAGLQAFTDRNASRRTVIEIDDAELGAQDLETDYPLRGVSYDTRDERVEIMLGDLGDAGSHMTHSIEEVTEVAVLAAADGRDELLRIAYPGGQTLLRISDY